jgi:hypothetical protein
VVEVLDRQTDREKGRAGIMSGSELEGQKRNLFGLDVAHCDLCGVAMPVAQLREFESASPMAEHDHTYRICPACWDRIHLGEIDVESILQPEEERRERGDEWTGVPVS